MRLENPVNRQNTYKLNGTKHGRKPMYVEIFKYLEKHLDKQYFTKLELMKQTNYASVGISPYAGEYIFAQFNHNGILVYDKHMRKWTYGPNYREYVNTYILNKPKLETYHMVLTKDRLMEKKPEISETNAKDLVKMMAKSKLRQAIDLLNEATEMLKSIE